MNKNRNRKSRYEDTRSSSTRNQRSDFNSGSSRGYNQNDIFSARDLGPVGIQQMPSKSPDQMAFVSTFRRDPVKDFSIQFRRTKSSKNGRKASKRGKLNSQIIRTAIRTINMSGNSSTCATSCFRSEGKFTAPRNSQAWT